jgi:hypothetical protein
MHQLQPVLLMVAVVLLSGCAATLREPPPDAVRASAPDPRASIPVPHPLEDVRRVAVVVSGDSRFALVGHGNEPARAFDEVLSWDVVKWSPYAATFRPLATLVHWGINWLLAYDDTKDTKAHIGDLSPRAILAQALAQRLQASGRFEARGLDREPFGDDRRRADAIVRVIIPAWGVVRVRENDPPVVSAFVDVHAQLVAQETGSVLWETVQDVTGAQRAPLESFTKDREYARQELTAVLERAAQRIATELLYGAGR